MKKTNAIVDGWLVLQYQSGDKKALAVLVKRWHKVFCNKAYWITKDKDISNDIAQESWKVIMRKLHGLKDVNSFGSWALTIVYRKAIDWIRNHKRETEKLREYFIEQSSIEDEANDEEPLKKSLLKAILKLSENQQTVINLFYVEEYSLQQIGEILNISVGTAKSRLFHAREKLKLILKHRTDEN